MTSPKLEEALAFAARLHCSQVRKGTGIPYIAHLLAVAAGVAEHGGDETQMIAALLHDGPEDQGGQATLDEIRRRFGDEVADIVLDCTDTMESPKPAWRKRKEDYLSHLATVKGKARLISAMDKLYNAEATFKSLKAKGREAWNIFSAPASGQLWYYRALVEEYKVRGPVDVAARLSNVVDQLEHFA